MSRQLTEEETFLVNKFRKRCPTTLVIREMQIKTMLKYRLYLLNYPKLRNLKILSVAVNVESYLPLAGGGSKMV